MTKERAIDIYLRVEKNVSITDIIEAVRIVQNL